MLQFLVILTTFLLSINTALYTEPQQATTAQPIATGRIDQIRSILLDPYHPQVLIVAHRAGHIDAPENSIAAIEEAIAAGAHMVELDVRKTKDNRYILMHDKTIDRTTTGEGRVDQLTLKQIQAQHLLHNGQPSSHIAPTLQEALLACKGRILVNIDPKAIDFKQAVSITRKLGVIDHCVFKANLDKLDDQTRVWFSLQNDVIFMPICEGTEAVESALKVHSWPAIELLCRDQSDPFWNPGALENLKSRGVRPWLNTLWDGRLSAGFGDEIAATDPDTIYHPVFEMGWGIIQTDLPAALAESFERFTNDHP